MGTITDSKSGHYVVDLHALDSQRTSMRQAHADRRVQNKNKSAKPRRKDLTVHQFRHYERWIQADRRAAGLVSLKGRELTAAVHRRRQQASQRLRFHEALKYTLVSD